MATMVMGQEMAEMQQRPAPSSRGQRCRAQSREV